MSEYDNLMAVATEVFGAWKQGTINIVQLTPGAGAADNPGAPTETTTALNAVTVEGALYRYQKEGLAIAGDTVVKSSIVSGITPTKNDFIQINGVRYKIIAFTPIPIGEPVAWEFLVRRG